MRFAAVKTIYEEALKNKKLYFLSGDMGHLLVDEFKTNIKERYMNTGIGEQNLVGIAAGLALSGMKVVIYSIIPFVTMRCYEQVKADLCYQNLDVTIVGVGGGFDYGLYGNTHCSIEDIAVMRVLPNMKIACPANPLETEQLTRQVLNMKGPTYVRIGRGKEPMPENTYSVKFGEGLVVKKGTDVTIFSTGTILPEAEKTAHLLEKNNISTEVINLHTVKPLDKDLILDRIRKRKGLFTMEEHNIIGGLGGAVAETISENNSHHPYFKRYGVQDIYLFEVGKQDYLREQHGISAEIVSQDIIKLLHQSVV